MTELANIVGGLLDATGLGDTAKKHLTDKQLESSSRIAHMMKDGLAVFANGENLADHIAEVSSVMMLSDLAGDKNQVTLALISLAGIFSLMRQSLAKFADDPAQDPARAAEAKELIDLIDNHTPPFRGEGLELTVRYKEPEAKEDN